VGTVREVLGSDADDSFRDISVQLSSDRRGVLVDAGGIAGRTAKGVERASRAREIEALTAYDDVATYHLASVGWLRKHLGWTKDSAKDEEPG